MTYVKLSNLVGEQITIESVLGFKFKKWDSASNQMLESDDWQKDYRKLYQVVTDKGQLDLGSGQIGNLLEPVFHGGKADIVGVTYEVKSNGKSGMEIRYFFNPVKTPTAPAGTDDEPPINLEDIGW